MAVLIVGKRTKHGFSWGPAEIECLFADLKRKTVTLGIKTAKTELQIYITKTGKVRVFQVGGKELK